MKKLLIIFSNMELLRVRKKMRRAWDWLLHKVSLVKITGIFQQKTEKMAPHLLLKEPIMNKGVIIHLDNELEGVLKPSQGLFNQLGFDVDYIICETKELFETEVTKNQSRIKGLIFDLLSKEPSVGELEQRDAEFLKNVQSSFARFNIPIFIYSGYLDALGNDFDSYGTVFKFDKGDAGIQPIFDKFKFLYDSGFIDVFCPGGVLETEIKDELHNSFTRQFSKNSQIEDVIKNIQASITEDEGKAERVKKIFKRITIKTLASDLLAPVADSEDKVHPIEHFYKRQSKLPIWTGDIWKKKSADEFVLVLTPRCDFAAGKATTLIYITVANPPTIQLGKKAEENQKNIRNHLTDNLLAKSSRYIPANPFFPSGGMAMLANHYTLSIVDFTTGYDYVVTLSDDLTNEIIGKFAYYFLRTGITNINEQEFEAILSTIN